jgi:hypothetical protein
MKGLAMAADERPDQTTQPPRSRKKAHRLIPSRLRVRSAEKILSNGHAHFGQFRCQRIFDKNVMEVGSGGSTDLMAHFEDLGASSVVSTDLVAEGHGKRPHRYLRADMNDLHGRAEEIRQSLGGSLPDTIVGTSLFGAASLSYKETKRWLKECSNLLAPGGEIIVDFLVHTRVFRKLARHFKHETLTRMEFEEILKGLQADRTIQSWKRADKVNWPTFYWWPKPLRGLSIPMDVRPCSVTFRICVAEA